MCHQAGLQREWALQPHFLIQTYQRITWVSVLLGRSFRWRGPHTFSNMSDIMPYHFTIKLAVNSAIVCGLQMPPKPCQIINHHIPQPVLKYADVIDFSIFEPWSWNFKCYPNRSCANPNTSS